MSSRSIPSDVPILRRSPAGARPRVPSHLKMSVESRESLELHVNTVGLDKLRYLHTITDQGQSKDSKQEPHMMHFH
jgi:hypothetical protein